MKRGNKKLLRHNKHNPIFKLIKPISLFLLVLLFGILGYIFIENYSLLEAVYMTVITLSTVGYSEVKPLSDEGRIFTTILIITNLGLFTYFIAIITRYFLDGDFLKDYKLFIMTDKIEQLQNHVILCGLGRNGKAAAETLLHSNIPFVVIESHAEKIEKSNMPISCFILADATTDEALIEAGIHKARALIITLPDDSDNLYTVLTARELNKKLLIVTRASKDSSVRKLKIAGANNVLMPDKLGGAHMATLVASPDVKEFIDLISSQSSSDFMIKEIVVNKEIELRKVDCWIRTGATVLGIKKDDNQYILNPQPELTVQQGWRLIVMGSEVQLTEVAKEVS
jgi:voltage-gated potassium channel